MVEQQRAGRQRADQSVNVVPAPRSMRAPSFSNIKEWITSREKLGCFPSPPCPPSNWYFLSRVQSSQKTYFSSFFNCSYFLKMRKKEIVESSALDIYSTNCISPQKKEEILVRFRLSAMIYSCTKLENNTRWGRKKKEENITKWKKRPTTLTPWKKYIQHCNRVLTVFRSHNIT